MISTTAFISCTIHHHFSFRSTDFLRATTSRLSTRLVPSRKIFIYIIQFNLNLQRFYFTLELKEVGQANDNQFLIKSFAEFAVNVLKS